jgi:GntR family transcriptional regulator
MTESRFSTRPLYLQLREALLERIAAGQWKAGNAIPNEADLAREFGVSPGTMRKALDLLEAQRVLTRRQGRGTFVNDQSSAEMAQRYNKLRGPDGRPFLGPPEVGAISTGDANESEMLRLGLDPQARVYRFRRTYYHQHRRSWWMRLRCLRRYFPASRSRGKQPPMWLRSPSAMAFSQAVLQSGLRLAPPTRRAPKSSMLRPEHRC